MVSKSFILTLQLKSPLFKNATSLEDVLCFATLMASKAQRGFKEIEDVNEAREMWLEVFEGDCEQCPYHNYCLACIINE